MRIEILVAFTLIAGLPACKGDKGKTEPPSATSSAKAVPSAAAKAEKEPAEKPAHEQVAEKAAKENTADGTASEEAAEENPLPDIPPGRSKPPTAFEWRDAEALNTQEAHSRAENCEMKIVREWLKVYCYGDIVGHADLSGVGQEHRDYFAAVRKGKSADLVIRLHKGQTVKGKVIRKDAREAVLYVVWPESKPKPVHVALGRGKPPEKEEEEEKDEKPKSKQAKAVKKK